MKLTKTPIMYMYYVTLPRWKLCKHHLPKSILNCTFWYLKCMVNMYWNYEGATFCEINTFWHLSIFWQCHCYQAAYIRAADIWLQKLLESVTLYIRQTTYKYWPKWNLAWKDLGANWNIYQFDCLICLYL